MRGGPTVSCIVFDGAVDVQSGSPQSYELRAGMKRVWNIGGTAESAVSREEIEQTAALYARLDSVKSIAAGGQPSREERAELEAAYVRVFRTPADATARLDLAAQQANLKITGDAVYQLRQAERLVSAVDNRQKARVSLTRAVILEKTGDRNGAAEEIRKAQQADPAVFNRAELSRYRIDPATIQVISPTIRIENFEGDVR
jgi:hypothetical protein